MPPAPPGLDDRPPVSEDESGRGRPAGAPPGLRPPREAGATALLDELASRLWRTPGLESGLQEILDAAIALTRADKGNVQLFDPERQVLRIVAHRGFSAAFLDTFREVGADHATACGAAMLEGRRVVLGDIEAELERMPLLSAVLADQCRAVQSTPLIGWDGILLGVVSTHFKAPSKPADEELRRLDVYARLAGAFIERRQREQAMQESEARLRMVLKAVEAGTWRMDLRTGHVACDERTSPLLELAAGELAPRLAHLHAEDRPHVDERLGEVLRASRADDQWDLEFRILRADGSIAWVHGLGQVERGADGRILRVAGINLDISSRKQAEEALRRNRDEMQAYAQELEHRGLQLRRLALELTLAEQRAREELLKVLHDHLQQLLFSAHLKLANTRQAVAGRTAQGVELLDQVEQELEEAIATTRSLAAELYPAVLHERSLPAALSWLGDRMKHKHGLSVTLAVDPRADPNRKDMRVLIFESVRELLFNVVKHAGTSEATVEAAVLAEKLMRITVADDGVGFDTGSLSHPAAYAGLGLLGIRERLVPLGGHLEADGAPGRGVRISIVLPRYRDD